MEKGTNAAGRLYDFLTAVKKLSGGSEKSRKVLGTVFGIEQNDDLELRRKLSLIDEMFEITEEQIRSIAPANSGVYLEYFPKMRRAVATLHLDAAAKNLTASLLAPDAMAALKACAARIGEDIEDAQISEKDLEKLSQRVAGLFNAVDSGEFDPEFRTVVLDILSVLRRAIDDYRIRGVEGLREALEHSIGILVYRYAEDSTKAPEEQVHRVWDLLVLVDTVASRGLTYGPVLTAAAVEAYKLLS